MKLESTENLTSITYQHHYNMKPAVLLLVKVIQIGWEWLLVICPTNN